MENEYILTPAGDLVSADELRHWGIKGQKWGIRRYQNPDGSLTPAGRKRYTNNDGTLNEKGQKYMAKETERLKTERTKIENQKKVDAQLAKLDKMRQSNEKLRNPDKDEEIEKEVQKRLEQEMAKIAPKADPPFNMNNMSDKELNDTLNRMRNEDALKELLSKRGYNISVDSNKNELEQKIDYLTNQKKVLELERDITNTTKGKSDIDKRIEALQQKKQVLQLEKDIAGLTPEKKSKLVKFLESPIGKTLTDKAINVGADIIKDKLTKQKSNTQQNDQQNKQQNKPQQDKPQTNQNGGNKTAKEHKSERRAEERAAERAYSDEVASKIVRYVDNKIHRNRNNIASEIYGTPQYKKKVDSMLDKMDSDGWEFYNTIYGRDDD